MAKGLLNLNRFKHGRVIKRNSKQKRDLQGGQGIEARRAKIRG